MQRVTLRIDGMSCGHCVRAVRSALEGVDGVRVEEVTVGSAVVAYDPARADPARIARAVAEEGYAAQPAGA